MIIAMVCGLPGSGKSFFASRLAERISAIYASSDQIRKRIYSSRTYSPKEKKDVYVVMLNMMEQAIHDNKNIVLDATFYKKEIRKYFFNKAKKLKTKLFLIEITASKELTMARLSKTREDSDAGIKVYFIIKSQFDPIKKKHLILESAQDNIEEMIKKALDYLSHEQQ